MSDRLDDRIRELYAELAGAAPDLPPLPAAAPARRPMGFRPVALAAAGVAALVIVLGVGVGVLNQLDSGDDDAAAADITPPAATFAPSPGDSADTIVGGPELPPSPGEQRPTDRIVLLAELNEACAAAGETLGTLPAEPSARGEYIAAFDLVVNQVGPIRQLALAAEDLDDPTLAAIGSQALTVLQILEQGPGDDLGVAAARLDAALIETRTLGVLLEAFGAENCAVLSMVLIS